MRLIRLHHQAGSVVLVNPAYIAVVHESDAGRPEKGSVVTIALAPTSADGRVFDDHPLYVAETLEEIELWLGEVDKP